MSRAPALAALGVGLLLVASPLLMVGRGAAGFPAAGLVLSGSLALYGVLAAVAGWFGRRSDAHGWLLWGLAVLGVVLVGVPVAGAPVGVLTWAIVVALAALVTALPGSVVLFRARPRTP